MPGTKYIHIHIPCPPGWGYDPRYGIKIGRLAVETGYYDLYEIVNGEFKTHSGIRKACGKTQAGTGARILPRAVTFKILTDAQDY